MAMAQIAPTEKGGNCRLALTDDDRRGRDLFVRWCEAAGMSYTVDRMGNIFARRPGTDPSALPVSTGSHLDTQPTGGKFDGVYGVLAGLEVVRTLNDAAIETEAPIEVICWTNEEGARFRTRHDRFGRVFRRLQSGIRPFAKRCRRQDHCRGTRTHRLSRGRGTGRTPTRVSLRGPYRAGAHPRGREENRGRGDRRPGPALVRCPPCRPWRRTRGRRRWKCDAMPSSRRQG